MFTLTQLSLNTLSTYSAIFGAAILSGSDPPMSRHTILPTIKTLIITVKRQKIRGVLISWISWWALTHEINTPRKYSKYLLLVRPNCSPMKITSNELDLSPQTTKLSSHELLPFYSS